MLSLQDGRYDTPDHSLFTTLLNVHKDDFYQPCEPSIKAMFGPRMPWQDIHARVEGPAARDIMINFVERYASSKYTAFARVIDVSFRWGKERPLNSRLLIQSIELPDYDINLVPGLGERDADSWAVQVFRSITSDSARYFIILFCHIYLYQ